MIFRRLGLINKNQRGFTLAELIVALAITGLITGGITMSIFQVFDINTRSNNHMTAVRQVQNAGYWISHDAQMARDVAPDPGDTGFPLVLTWTEWGGTVNEVTYTLVDSELKRSHSVDGEPSETVVAQYIDSVSCQLDPLDNRKLTFTITATVSGGWKEASETRVYEVIPRPDS